MAELHELNWTEVDSSNVGCVGYHQDSKTLAVEFLNGGLYAYKGVDNETYVAMIHAESVGRYLNSVIKVNHPYTKFVDRDELLRSL